ncbi:MAG: protein kinase, partial [Rhodopirellula sp. JB044]|uniref:protein kinase domain-containing protein n=1 Tax=Rhodopirellula sp. JB044 TaxID=3342844 RepID=UPI003709F14D
MSLLPPFSIDDDRLRRFAAGRLLSEESQRVALAIELSPSLQSRLAEISDDEMLSRAKLCFDSNGKPALLDHTLCSIASQTNRREILHESPPGVPQELADLPNYHVLEELGHGGMGVVYLAHNSSMGRLEVLKILNNRHSTKDLARKRFLQEMQLIGSLNHPFIATAFGRIDLPNMLVFAMEYVPGMNLHRFVQQYHPIPICIVCSLISKTATALQYAHSRNLVHRDIKPSNVMVFESDNEFTIKVLDFGLAKISSEQVADGITLPGMTLGTAEYMAPEQARDATTADIRADIYSLGCTLFHLIASVPPFEGTTQSLLLSHAQDEPNFQRLNRREVPNELVETVKKMMAKSRLDRFQNPQEVIDALQPFTDSAPITRFVATTSHSNIGSRAPSSLTETGFTERSTIKQGQTATTDYTASERTESDSTETVALPAPQHTKKRYGIVGIGVASLLFLLSVIFIHTPTGTLVIENLPERAEVRVDGNEVAIVNNGHALIARTTLAAGVHLVSVTSNGLTVHGSRVTIVDDDEHHIVLRSEPNATSQVESTGEPPTSPPKQDGHVTSDAMMSASPQAEVIYGSADEWTVDGDHLINTSSKAAGYYGLLFGEPSWTDYEFTFEFRCSTAPICTSVFIRCVDDNNTFEAGVAWHNSLATLSQRRAGYYRLHTEPMKPLLADKWYEMRVVVVGDTVKTFIDGVQILDADTPISSHGKLGFLCYRRTAGEITEFRNIHVVTPDGHSLWSSVPSLPLVSKQSRLKKATNVHSMSMGGFPIHAHSGDWTHIAGVWEQHRLHRAPYYLVFGDKNWTDYDFSFRARRRDGTHGVSALYQWRDEGNLMNFAIGNYKNTGHDASYLVDGKWGRDTDEHFHRLEA